MNNEVSYPVTALGTRLSRQAAATPGRIAVRLGAETIDYAGLEVRANQLAWYLRDRGIGPESRVAIALPRSIDLVAALFGVVKAGAAYVPIDVDYPPARIALMVEDCGAPFVLTSGEIAGGPPALRIDQLDLSAQPPGPPPPPDPDNAAYVIYTSGSTGRPKGVVVSHRAISNRLDWMQSAYRLAPADVVLQKTSVGFDVSVWEFFWPISVGATLVLAEPGGHRDGEYLRDLIVSTGVTVCHFVPSMLRAFLTVDRVSDCVSLRDVVCSGEALDADLVVAFQQRLAARLHNLYGPTEAAVDVTYWECPRGFAGDPVPIGRPIHNIQVYVLDDELSSKPVGVEGELYLGGVGLARGYLDRPALTAAAFVPDPFTPGGRLYRTGDLARVDRAGDLNYLGRRDSQVKVRGHRVELGEIEAVLRTHPHVSSAAVVTDRQRTDVSLVAYVVSTRRDLSGADVRSWLVERLPAHLVPAQFVLLESLPISAHGKLDRAALPPPQTEPCGGEKYRAPRTPLEATIAAVFAEVLGARRVGVLDNFFERGGDSIRALRAVGLLRERRCVVSVPQIFRAPTAAGLAAEVSRPVVADHPPVPPPPGWRTAEEVRQVPFSQVTPADRAQLPPSLADAYPLTHVQVAMAGQAPDTTVYRIGDEAPFDLDALRRAVAALVARHDVLRTRVDRARFSQPLHLVAVAGEADVAYRDLRGQPQDEIDAALAEVGGRDERLRVSVVQTAGRVWYLGWSTSGTLLDRYSHDPLIAELLATYRAVRDGAEAHTGRARGVGFGDFVALAATAAASAEHHAFWSARIRPDEPDRLPAGWGGAAAGHYQVRVRVGDLLPALRAAARSTGTPLKTVVLAAHLCALGEATGAPRLRTALATNGRPEARGGDVAYGMFDNAVPLAVPLRPGCWRDLVAAVFAEELALWPHRRYPHPVMAREFNGGRPLADVLFAYAGFTAVEHDGLDVLRVRDTRPNAYALVVTTEPGALVLTCDSARIRPDLGQRLSAAYLAAVRLIAGVAGEPQTLDARAVSLASGS
jgi:amino acid adenylation domain-containing protein